jgi:hypothetical protein
MRIARPFPSLGIVLSVTDAAKARQFELLHPYSETKVERIERFIAAEAFSAGTMVGSRGLSVVGSNFVEKFLNVVEENVPAQTLTGWSLLYTAGDTSLIQAMGGEERATVPFLAYIHRLMEIGETGPSHVGWRSNFAYARSPVDGRLWAVHWSVNHANEWNLGAVYVPHPHVDWRADSRLFQSSAQARISDPGINVTDGSRAQTGN